ncbi:O-antigen ligase family protein [Fundicoccus sp. Sow4_H7]|uniref:O-antigen ligase family protein n=1 Tax=Fundicoccus sp. Sow4_H7 TaxID=3438784 RepID=UPI003F8DEE00
MQKWLTVPIYLMILLAFFPFSNSSIFAFAMAMLLFTVLVWNIAQQNIRFRHILNPYTALMTILLAWSLLSLFWVVDRTSWAIATLIIFITLIFALALSYLMSNQDFRKKLAFLIIAIMVIHNLVGWYDLFQYMGRTPLDLPQLLSSFQLSGRMTFFGNVNDFALLSLFGLIFVLAWKPQTPPNKYHWLMIFKMIFILSSVLMIYFVQSRGILFAAFYGIIFYLILQIKKSRIRWTAFATIFLAALLTIVFLYSEILDALWSDGSFVIRLNLIKNGWNHLKLSRFMGVGAGNTEYYMAHYNFHNTAGYTVMHNWWMGMLVEYGLPFFLLYGLYHVRVFLSAFFWSLKYKGAIEMFVATWLLAFIVAGFIPNTLFNFLWFWFLHNFVFVWYEFRATDEAELEFGLKTKLVQLGDWMEAKLFNK